MGTSDRKWCKIWLICWSPIKVADPISNVARNITNKIANKFGTEFYPVLADESGYISLEGSKNAASVVGTGAGNAVSATRVGRWRSKKAPLAGVFSWRYLTLFKR